MCEYIKYSASVGNNDMQAYNKKDLIIGSIAENSTYTETTTKQDTAPQLPNCNQGPPARRSHPCS
jgi:hypothetical protein